MMKFYSTVRVGINDVPVPTYRTIMKKEHAMGFHSLDPLTDAFGMQKWFIVVSQVSHETH